MELLADDENTPNKVAPVRSSLRELPGTAQVFAKSGEPVPASSLLLRATRRTALSQRNHGLDVTDWTFELRHTFVILPSAFSKQFPPKGIFNLKTNSSYGVGDTYQIEAHLDDGTQHNVTIAIRR